MSDVVRYFRVIKSEDISARTGQHILVNARGDVSGRAYEERADGSGAQRIASTVGIMFRFRRKDTWIYDSYVADKENTSVDNKIVFIDGTNQFVANFDYDNVELAAFVEHGPLSDGYTFAASDRLSIEDIEAKCIVADSFSASQGL